MTSGLEVIGPILTAPGGTHMRLVGDDFLYFTVMPITWECIWTFNGYNLWLHAYETIASSI